MPDRPSPMTAGERAGRNAERRALRATDLQITFAPPIVPPAPGLRVFPPPVTGTLADRPDRTIVREEISRFEENPSMMRPRVGSRYAEPIRALYVKRAYVSTETRTTR
jgi:hypothetical protein